MYEISVIIPVYNAESTLENAITSIINQTLGFENIEVILIDDKSTDNSRTIISKYAKKYKNIKVIFFDENSGSPSEPRNIGIKNITAPYLMFLDSDDYFTPNCLKTLLSIAYKENADLIQCIYVRKLNDNYYIYNHVNECNTNYIKTEDFLELRGTVWGNLFKSSLVKNNISFYDVLHEDGVFLLECSIKANKIFELPNFYGYIYNLDQNSLTHTINFETIQKYIRGFRLQNDILVENNLQKKKLFNSNIPMIFFMFFKFKGSYNDKIEILKKIRKFEKSLNYHIKLRSRPIEILNNLVLNEKYTLAIILSYIASTFYNNTQIKNFIFKRYSNIKKINLSTLTEKEND